MYHFSCKIRPQNELTLNNNPKVYVNGQIVQYLLAHQINGIQFLYDNYKKQISSILNDENGSGKCFQCVAFLDAILRSSVAKKVLILCELKQNLEHWKYHIDTMLENVSAKIADNENNDDCCSSVAITIASNDYVFNHLSEFTANDFDCLILQDRMMQTSAESFATLNEIRAAYKIILCSNDLIDSLDYFYEILKFGNQMAPLMSKGNTILELNEFKLKFGCNENKSISKRNKVFRQRNLLNACNTFYLRRLCSQLGSQFPSVNAKNFESNFNAWKVNVLESVSNVAAVSLTHPSNTNLMSTTNDEVSILNVACTDFSDFDTQMSPLIYSDSEDSIHICDNEFDKSHDTGNSQNLTPEIACNQDHAARTRNLTKELNPNSTNSRFTPTKRNNRNPYERKPSASKRLSYKQLPIKTTNNRKLEFETQTYSFRTKKQCDTSQNLPKTSRGMSSASDVQIISQRHISPITISSLSEDRIQALLKSGGPESTILGSEDNLQSPDLFSSFASIKSQTVSPERENNCFGGQDKQDDGEIVIRDVFGPPDECDDIDLLSDRNVDIFEITKNNVFDNVLCTANNRITPFKKNPEMAAAINIQSSPSMSCLSGLRVVLPKLDGHQVAQIQSDLLKQLQSQSKPIESDIIDLTSSNSQKIIELSSDDASQNIEKTPEHKQQLTPSTRSCLKPSSSGEKRKRSAYSRLGWLSTSRTSPQCETPQSRRLDKWRRKINDMKSDSNVKVTKPRNLFKEFKSKPNQKLRQRNCASTRSHESPNIFSDND